MDLKCFSFLVIFYFPFGGYCIVKETFLPNKWYDLNVMNETFVSLFFPREPSEKAPTFLSITTEMRGEDNVRIDVRALLDESALDWSLSPDTQVNFTSAIMCFDCSKNQNHLILLLSSKSPTEIRFIVRTGIPEFPNDDVSRTLTLDSPHSYIVNLTQYPKAEFLSVMVDNVDDAGKSVCMMVAIQGPTCPLHNDQNIARSADSFGSVLQQGTFHIRTSEYSSSGLVLVSFFILPDDQKCHEIRDNSFIKNFSTKRRKELKYSLEPLYTSDYIIPSITLIITCILIGLISLFSIWCVASKRSQMRVEYEYNLSGGRSRNNSTPNVNNPERFFIMRNQPDAKYDSASAMSVKDSWFRRSRSRTYAFMVPIVLIFYFVPAAQVALGTKANEEEFGDKDICFHNFRCSRPLGNFDDFNHIISNLSYIILGFFFLFIVYLKSRRYKKTERVSPSPPPVLGTLRQLGMFYALGFGLMGQGLMSTCFHICPTTITIQFDTSVMYMILIISIVKIGQFRHPDATPNALWVFIFIGILTFSEALTIYFPSNIIYAMFYVFHLFVTLVLAFDIYYVGFLRVSIFGILKNLDKLHGPVRYKRLFFTLGFATLNVASQGLLIALLHRENTPTLSMYILPVLGLNLIVYLFFFIGAKQCQQGRQFKLKNLFTLGTLFTLLSVTTSILAFVAFVQKTSNRTLSPAESRNLNLDCSYMNFYDAHDGWHFWSALGVFFAFVALLDVDEDLTFTTRSQIPLH